MPKPTSYSPWNEILTSAHAWYLLREKLPSDSRMFCRAVLSYYAPVDPADWKFKSTRHGKPQVIAPRGYSSLKFNLTHTARLMVCVVTRAGAVGIDAEETSREVDIDQVARHFYSGSERAGLARLSGKSRNRRFFEIWVLKEAYLKGRARGLTISPERISIEFADDVGPAPIGNWQLSLYHLTRNHVAAAAIRPRKAGSPIPILWRNAEELFKA